MKVLEKIELLIKGHGITERQFLMQYHAHFGLAKRIRGGYNPNVNDVKKMCRLLNFDPVDFLDPTSTLVEPVREGEHLVKPFVQASNNAVYEDYPHEDNSRYEEKD